MQSKRVLGGIFEVFPDGRINRIKNGICSPAHITHTNGYQAVSYMNRANKEKIAYVHRLVAQAFVPNPNQKPQVNHIDGNKDNNAADNLEWVTPKENTNHAYRIGLISPNAGKLVCKYCGRLTAAEDEICPICKSRIESFDRNSRKRATWADEACDLLPVPLSKSQRKYVELRANGLSVSEIASVTGVSRQCVDEALKTARKRAEESMAYGCETLKMKDLKLLLDAISKIQKVVNR